MAIYASGQAKDQANTPNIDKVVPLMHQCIGTQAKGIRIVALGRANPGKLKREVQVL